MQKHNKFLCISMALLFAISSCVKDKITGTKEQTGVEKKESTKITEITIPTNFKFSTDRSMSLNISDTSNNIRYDIYMYDTLTSNATGFLYKGVTVNGSIVSSLKIPIDVAAIKLNRYGSNIHTEIIALNANEINYTHNN